jgi:hypothetical protein
MGRHDSTADGAPATARAIGPAVVGRPPIPGATVLVGGVLSGCDESRLDRWHFPY